MAPTTPPISRFDLFYCGSCYTIFVKQIDLVVKAINTSLAPKRIILFGSWASDKVHAESDLDIAVIQETAPKIGQKAKIILNLARLGYNWEPEPDIHLFSEKEFKHKLKEKDLFVTQISEGKTIYVQ